MIVAVIVTVILIVVNVLVFTALGVCETICVLLTITQTRTGTCFEFGSQSPPPNMPPLPDHGGPYVGVVGVAVSMSAALSTDPEGATLSAGWSFGDGSTGSGLTTTHAYASPGVYNVRVTVSDGSAMASAATTATIGEAPVVDPLPPGPMDVPVP